MKIKKIISNLANIINRLLFRSRIDDRERTHPINDNFGYNRGTPIDRFYIRQAIDGYSENIKGTVLEIGGRQYTEAYSKTDPKDSFILNYIPMPGSNVIVGDLCDCSSLEGRKFDTFVCTQTLNFIYDFKSAIDTSYELLNAGGYFIGTVASVSNISKYDNSRWGDFWRFTKKGMEAVLAESKFEIIDIKGFGNVLAAKAMFDGFVVEDFDNNELLNFTDSGYPVIISFLCRRSILNA